jgi:predicted SnoaL-like aldol condensation-catalyzing enzyme
VSAVGDIADLPRALLDLLSAKKVVDMASQRENVSLIRKLYDEVLNEWKLEYLDNVFAEDYVDHSGFVNREGIRKALSDHRKAFVDIKFKIEDIISERDEVVVRSLVTLQGNKESKTVSQITVYRIRDGKIVESWAHSDSFF